jgi:hypothetical protein
MIILAFNNIQNIDTLKNHYKVIDNTTIKKP